MQLEELKAEGEAKPESIRVAIKSLQECSEHLLLASVRHSRLWALILDLQAAATETRGPLFDLQVARPQSDQA